MAISVNDVYQRVLAITNKEKRGYLSPQEYNTLANYAQDEIFKNYFYDLELLTRVRGNDTGHSDRLDIIQEKIEKFEKNYLGSANLAADGTSILLPSDFYKIVAVYHDSGTLVSSNVTGEAQYVSEKEFWMMKTNPLLRPNGTRPLYTFEGKPNSFVNMYVGAVDYSVNPTGYQYGGSTMPQVKNDECRIVYVRKPLPVKWAYDVIGSGPNTKPIWNQGASQNFELHISDKSELVAKILKYLGITLSQDRITGFAAQEEANIIQQEKL